VPGWCVVVMAHPCGHRKVGSLAEVANISEGQGQPTTPAPEPQGPAPWKNIPELPWAECSRNHQVHSTLKTINAPTWIDFPTAAQVTQIRHTPYPQGQGTRRGGIQPSPAPFLTRLPDTGRVQAPPQNNCTVNQESSHVTGMCPRFAEKPSTQQTLPTPCRQREPCNI